MRRTTHKIYGTSPKSHSMGSNLERYVLPKVPDWVIEDGRPVEVVPVTRLSELGAGKGGKLFNWRRPTFVSTEDSIQCKVVPGVAYVRHYGLLVATAANLHHKTINVTAIIPAKTEIRNFISCTLPKLPFADVIVLGYVDRIRIGNSDYVPWVTSAGWGWKLVDVKNRHVLLLGCEFSFWGDVSGYLVAELFTRKVSDWVLYVGKLGTLNSTIIPNRVLATGNQSLVYGRFVEWEGYLMDILASSSNIFCDAKHITVDSVVEETTDWLSQYVATYDLVDPEIGHMGLVAQKFKAMFDYFHIVTDCLSADYGVGLYNERSTIIEAHRKELLDQASTLIEYAIISR